MDFPKVVAITNSKQFYAAYTIVMDLILYSEPVKSSDPSSLIVCFDYRFQRFEERHHSSYRTSEKIRRFDDIRVEFLYRMSELTDSSIRDLAKVELLQENLLFELGVMVMAIKAGMQRGSEESSHFSSGLLLRNKSFGMFLIQTISRLWIWVWLTHLSTEFKERMDTTLILLRLE